jgi:hypothetical protein
MLGVGSPANGSGANIGWYGVSDTSSSSNVTISNAFVTANSVILLNVFCAAGGVVSPPTITSQTAGSFVVNQPNPGASFKYYYYILSQ